MNIAQFYQNREIFITGGTGYLGKSLIEKLLRDCPGIPAIYMLIRGKRGKTSEDRLKDFKNDFIFERLHRENPNVFKKLIPIQGDCIEKGLGISNEDLQRLKNVSVLFHEAACVRFDNDLRSSLLMNTRGTYELVQIALKLKSLISFVHVSTAYIYPAGTDIAEQIYTLPNDWRKAIKIAETCDTNSLEVLKYKYTNNYPNSYPFTKNLSEKVISDFADKLPMTILRPAVVAHSYKEPEPGFMDNLNGPMGLLAAMSTGISQLSYVNPDLNMALLPVDILTSLTIAACSKRGLEQLENPNSPLTIRTLAPRDMFPYSLGQCAKKFNQLVIANPLQDLVWYPSARMTMNMSWYLTWMFLVQIPMSLFYDTLLIIFRKTPMLMKTTRRIIYTSITVGDFAHKFYNFQNDGMVALFDLINTNDENKAFCIAECNYPDCEAVFQGLLAAFKKYIFKEPMIATASARRRLKIIYILNESIKFIVFVVIVKYLWKCCN